MEDMGGAAWGVQLLNYKNILWGELKNNKISRVLPFGMDFSFSIW